MLVCFRWNLTFQVFHPSILFFSSLKSDVETRPRAIFYSISFVTIRADWSGVNFSKCEKQSILSGRFNFEINCWIWRGYIIERTMLVLRFLCLSSFDLKLRRIIFWLRKFLIYVTIYYHVRRLIPILSACSGSNFVFSPTVDLTVLFCT